ncbi:hypothetical protein A2415_03500 [candidate division WWE3 bacterium RIFOXYC1_FULL_39_7]|uniref:DUF4349 domain-containing protein n=2 Tax=Katanobacteria TaxID=422282 RepID=A0A1F4XA06_UNCKA|nr:MAG: hypothetical protein A2415_03500 [candidate division WWE3 bacterium RIFOXYC1_FULL_39_7]OGC78371.1 MAG: hypothetical protein A2619_05085 [candidate division WWE3 bacterium RIFOXYD1_FULL_39_9]
MLSRLFNWTKNNKLATVLILFVLYKFFNPVTIYQNLAYRNEIGTFEGGYGAGMGGGVVGNFDASQKLSMSGIVPPADYQVAPTPEIQDRMMITESYISLQVENVTSSIEQIKSNVIENKGYIVSTYLDRPEFGENATLQVRVPSEYIDELLVYLRGNSVKVVTENITGTDITDQYVDVEERIKQLESNKARLETILNSARTVEDIMKVLPHIQSIQNQIDNYKGQIQYLEGASSTSLVTIYLSTDELSLPYAPVKSWRPDAIVKQAIRALIVSLQQIGTAAIWLGVFSVLIVPAITLVVIITVILKKRRHQ